MTNHKIENDEQLLVTIEQMGRMYRILEGLGKNELPKSQQCFAIMAEGPVDQIRDLLDEVDAYITEITRPLAEEADAGEAQQRAEKEREEKAA